MANKAGGLPQVNLKMGDFFHEVPAHSNLELIIEYKQGGVPRDYINPLESFAVEGEYLLVTNRISEFRYRYEIKKLKGVYLIPCE